MKPLLSLITIEEIEALASRSNFRYGREIAENAEITIQKKNTFNRIAEVRHGNSPVQTVEVMVTAKGLRWKCTCTNRKNIFCEHVVAVCLTALPSSPLT